MNVLWITNVPTGRISGARGCKAGVFGGWLDTLADQLSQHDGIHLMVAFPDHDSGTAPDFGQVSGSFDLRISKLCLVYMAVCIERCMLE